jgi:hypothetical protein
MSIGGVEKCLPTLRKLAKAKTKKERIKLLKKAKSCIYYSIAEISKNTLNGNIPVTEREKIRIQPYKEHLRRLARKSGVPLKEKKQIVLQSGGFLPGLLIPALTYLGGKLADRFF